MAVTLGSFRFTHAVAGDWRRLPDGRSFRGVAAGGVDRKDRVDVFNRGEHPMIVFDQDGSFLRSLGEVADTFRTRINPNVPRPEHARTLQTLVHQTA
jgi:hypothetical protein